MTAGPDVDVWIADLCPEPGESSRRLAATTTAERERAARWWKREDGDRYLSAHGALRLVLARYLERDPLALVFATGRHGKPHLPDGDLEFNLSHSGDLALIAIARGRRVGVDVEQLRPVIGLDDVAPRVCSAAELAMLASVAEPARTHAFLGLWTRKEALAKATGEGIQGLMRGAGGARADLESDPDPGRWTVVEVRDLAGYAASVAAEGTDWELVRHDVTAAHT